MLEEENKPQTNASGEEVEDSTDKDYLDAIKEIKQNSVDRKEYDKLKAENKKLLKAVVDGQPAKEETKQEVIPTDEDVNNIRKELLNPDGELSNLEYAQKALELRDAILKKGGRDPFLPKGRKVQITRDDIYRANNTAEVIRECIEYAKGDSKAFTNELMRRCEDDAGY